MRLFVRALLVLTVAVSGAIVPNSALAAPPGVAIPASAVSTGFESAGHEFASIQPGSSVPATSVPQVKDPGTHQHETDFVRTPAEPGSGPSASVGAASMLGGVIQASVITVKLADKTVDETNAAIPMSEAQSAVTSANAYWRSMTDNRVGMTIVASLTAFSSSAKSSQQPGEIADIVARELGWSQRALQALVLFVPGSTYLNNGAAGMTYSNGGIGGRIVMPQKSPLTNPVLAHEFGHAIGLGHANSLQCGSGAQDVAPGPYGGFADSTCSVRTYGDSIDIMGNSYYNLMPAVSSPSWDSAQLGRGDEIVNAGTITAARSFTLQPWAGTAAARAVRFTDARSGEVYYLELRSPVGYDIGVATGGNRGVKIVQQGGDNSSILLPRSTLPFPGNFNYQETWQAGSTFSTHAGTTVTILSVSDSAATVTVRPYVPPAVGSWDEGSLSTTPDQGVLTVRGWALDQANPSVSTSVHVYVTTPDGVETNYPVAADQPRPDVNQVMQVTGNHGFTKDFDLKRPGTYKVCIYAIGSGGNVGLGCRNLDVVGVPAPFGVVDGVVPGTGLSGAQLTVTGWAFDAGKPASSVPVHVYVTSPDGTSTKTIINADIARPDVNSVMGVAGNHGYSTAIPISQRGTYQVCAYAIGISGLSYGNSELGCHSLSVFPTDPPVGYLDSTELSLTASSAGIVAKGWTYDPGTSAASIPVHFYVTKPDGTTSLFKSTADQPRPDVNRILGVTGDHGYTTNLPVSVAGNYRVCAYGIAVSPVSLGNAFLGCSSISIAATPPASGYLDNVTLQNDSLGARFVAKGWTLDPAFADVAIPVHVYVTYPDGSTKMTPFTADLARPDVNRVLGVPGNHGYETGVPVTQRGSYRICTWGVGVSPLKSANALLGCRNVQY